VIPSTCPNRSSTTATESIKTGTDVNDARRFGISASDASLLLPPPRSTREEDDGGGQNKKKEKVFFFFLPETIDIHTPRETR